MQMEAVNSLAWHDIDPAVAHLEFPFSEIEFEMLSEGFNVLVNAAFQLAKSGGKPVELRHGAI